MARLRGMGQPRARDPARTRTNSISSVAYATDERASEEKTASATIFDRRSRLARTVAGGMPISHRLINTVPLLTAGSEFHLSSEDVSGWRRATDTTSRTGRNLLHHDGTLSAGVLGDLADWFLEGAPGRLPGDNHQERPGEIQGRGKRYYGRTAGSTVTGRLRFQGKFRQSQGVTARLDYSVR